MLDILLFIFLMTIIECGAVFLTAWLWKMIDKAHSENMEDLCFVGFVFSFIFACILGLMFASSAVHAAFQLIEMYA